MEGQKAGREEGRKGGKKEWRTKGTKGGRKEWREERREGGQKAVGEKRRTEGRTEVRSKGCCRASRVGLQDFFVFHHHWRNWSDFAASLWLVFTPVHLHDCPNKHTLKQGHWTGDRHCYCADPHWQWRPIRAEESHHFIISCSIKLRWTSSCDGCRLMSPPAQWTLITLSSPPHLHLHLALSQVTWCSIGTDVDSLSICGYGLTKLQLVISVSVSIKRMNYYFRAVDRWSWAAVVWRLHGQLCEVTGSTLWTGSQDEVRQWVILSPRSATDRPALLRSAEVCPLLSERRDQRFDLFVRLYKR